MKKRELTAQEKAKQLSLLAERYAGPDNAMPFHPVDQVLVEQMQAAIRHQHAKVEASKRAVNHVLKRIRDDHKVGYLLGAGTETYERLTEAGAVLSDVDVNELRERILPGSAERPGRK